MVPKAHVCKPLFLFFCSLSRLSVLGLDFLLHIERATAACSVVERASEIASDCVDDHDDDDDDDDDGLEIDTPLNHIYAHIQTHTHIYIYILGRNR